MDEASREQQREARRQKVLARSLENRSPVVDLATQQTETSPEGVTAELEEHPGHDAGAEGVSAAGEDSGKSASRLAAERRRQRILSKSNERMAKVQGDRVTGGRDDQSANHSGGGDALDDMLEEAEAEVFGQHNKNDMAEAKPTPPQQAYFKSSSSGPSYPSPARAGATTGAGAVASAIAQRKPSQAQVASGGAFKPTHSEARPHRQQTGKGSSKIAPSRRPAGNKALDQQPFDLAAVQSLAGSDKSKKGAANKRKNTLGGLQFWTACEKVTRTLLLLLAGAGVGGLSMPEGRAAVAQAKYEAELKRANSDVDPRSEGLLGAFMSRSDEGAAESEWDAPSREAENEGSGPKFGLGLFSRSGGSEHGARRRRGPAHASMYSSGGKEHPVETRAFANGAYDRDGRLISSMGDLFLDVMDCAVGWAHYLSAPIVPLGGSKGMSSVSAFMLAIFVRLIVTTAFGVTRIVLGLPAYPSARANSKPGMIMGMVLATVPMLGKVIAFGVLIKDIFADTTLVVGGTVLTMTLMLGGEEEDGPVAYLGGLISSIWGTILGVQGGDGSLKEL